MLGSGAARRGLQQTSLPFYASVPASFAACSESDSPPRTEVAVGDGGCLLAHHP